MEKEVTFNIMYLSEDYFKSAHYSITVKSDWLNNSLALVIKCGIKSNEHEIEKSIEDIKKELNDYINNGWRVSQLNNFYYKF